VTLILVAQFVSGLEEKASTLKVRMVGQQNAPALVNFLRRSDVRWDFFQLSAASERLPFDQPHEVGTGGEEVEIIGYGAGQDGLRFCRAGERACSPGPDRVQHFCEAALQHGAVKLGLGAEKIPRGSARDAGEGPYIAQAGTLVAILGEKRFPRVQDGFAGPGGITLFLTERQ